MRVLRSDHSVDIVRAGTSKLAIVGTIEKLTRGDGACEILRLGDKGAWPGNDCDLLSGTYSLSVDETPFDPRVCWNLASPGVSNTAAALEYLDLLDCESGRASFSTRRFWETYR